MIRFVAAPDGTIVPDVRRKLPGRGVWVDATRGAVALAVRRRAFARALKAEVQAAETLPDDVERLLRRAVLERLAMAQKAGLVTTGFERVREALKTGGVAGLLIASDAAEDGREKVLALAKAAANLHNSRTVVNIVSSAELEGTLGRERVVHVALAPGRLSELLFTDAARLRHYATGETHPATHREQPDEHVFAGPLAV
jgi:predicted RNA-binding protein YlxR (DUF448 family)